MKRMQRVIQVTFFSAALFSLIFSASAQGIKLQAGAGIGYEIPTGDYGGTTADFYAGTKYGLSGGINFHAKGRIGAAGVKCAAEIVYSSFSNSGSAETSGQGKVDVSQSVLSVAIGPEYMVSLPVLPLAPYAGVNLAFNKISGETKFNGVSQVPSGTFAIESVTRFGIGLCGGVVYKINPLLSLDVGAAYNLMNLVGKKFEVVDAGNPDRIDSYTALNDGKDPVAVDGSEHIVGSGRSIQSLRINASVLFGI
jgi:opacity protein-like surface antigen